MECVMSNPLITLANVTQSYRSGRGRIHALRGVSLTINAGESVALVGESGCGKSTLARIAVQLEKPEIGTVSVRGIRTQRNSRRRRRELSTVIQLVPQEAGASLDPRMTIGASIAEPLVIHRRGNINDRASRVRELLAEVGLDESLADRYPHQLSGGQRQRVAIARALALEPQLLIADEPVSALDVSVQAQILDLLNQIRQQRELALLVIAHDLAFVRNVADRIDVMYLGRIVESGPAEEVIAHPTHPYTAALIAAFPDPDPRKRNRRVVPHGEVPSAMNVPNGCSYASRCAAVNDICHTQDPALISLDTSRSVACHFPLR